MCSAKTHVRFTPKSGHVRCKEECPLCANSGHSVALVAAQNCHSRGVDTVPSPPVCSPVNQFGEAATKFNIKDFFDAVGTHVFVVQQRIKLLLQ